MKYFFNLALFLAFVSCANQTPEIKLGNLFSDHMVLQQQTAAPIWRKSEPGTIIHVEASWGNSAKIRTDKQGNWQVDLKTPEYGGPYTITIKARKSMVVIEDVLIGEVWLCSGQSNMEMPLSGWPPDATINDYKHEINQANYPEIRMFTVNKAISFSPLEKYSGTWQVCSPATAGDFSATAYFFGRHLYNQLDIPIGLVHSSWGGTPAESWTDADYLKDVEGYEGIENELSQAQVKLDEFNAWLGKIEKVDISNLSLEGSFKDLNLGDLDLASPEVDDADWKTMSLPVLWEDAGLNGFDGIVWFRKDFNYDGKLYPEGFKIFLGPIDDMDLVFVNGKKVGGIEEGGFWTKAREYEIPEGLLKEGKNVVAVRVVDTRGGGGIYGDKDLAILKGQNEVINLSGDWKYKPIGMFANNNLYKFGEGELSYENVPKLNFNFDEYAPTVLYNAMIHPLVPYSVKGVIWYQGEANVGRGKQYRTLFPQMIKNWRDSWQDSNLPFYYVQIAPYDYNESAPGATALLREAQFLTLKENNVGMVVTTDIGNPQNIHPGNKQEVGRRLALLALSNDYRVQDLVSSGPLYKSVGFDGNKATVEFSNIGGGVLCKGDHLTWFEIAGEDNVFYPANAEIVDNKVLVSSDSVKTAKYVRFGWSDIAEPNLFNKEGLPASPFRTSVD
jgi:sialate O-acetylesterase